MARIIDGLVLVLPIAIIYAIVLGATAAGPSTGSVIVGGGTNFGADLVAGLLMLAVCMAYEVFMLNRFGGRTLGKIAMGVRVLSLEDAPRPDGAIATNTAVVRGVMWWGPTALSNIIPTVGQIVSLFPILNGLWPLWDQPYRQSLNDKVARTVVVSDR